MLSTTQNLSHSSDCSGSSSTKLFHFLFFHVPKQKGGPGVTGYSPTHTTRLLLAGQTPGGSLLDWDINNHLSTWATCVRVSQAPHSEGRASW